MALELSLPMPVAQPPAATLRTIHRFAGSDGVRYGSTSAGGTSNYGTVFSLSPPVSPGGAEDWREWHGVQFEAVT
jgi:hypothetical protein